MIFRKAVLIIHGFAGGVYDEESLAHYLQSKRNLDVYTFTLPGHEKGVKMKNEYTEWRKSAEDMMEKIIRYGYKTVYVIGHSMGGVIATYIANKYKQVKKLVLAAPAFKYLYVEDKKLNILTTIKNIPYILQGYSKDEIISRFRSISPKAIQEFRKLVDTYQNEPQKLTKPVLIIWGDQDKIVPNTSALYVYENVKSKVKVYAKVKGCNHDLYRNQKINELNKLTYNFLKNKYLFLNKKIEL